MMLSLGFVIETLTGYRPANDGPAITSVVIDSREAIAGSLFVAFKGDRLDGHDFVADAFDRGAVAALVEHVIPGVHTSIDGRTSEVDHIYDDGAPETPLCLLVDRTLSALQALAQAWRERFEDLRVIGITGSVGKTTTKELTHAVLSRSFQTLKSEGNLNNEIGLPLTLLGLRSRHERAVLEMGMYTAGEIGLLGEIAQPQVGVVTMVGSVHMEWLGSIEAIAAAKQELVEVLPPSPVGVAILNKDEPLVMAMADHTEASVFTYGLDNSADLWADDISSMGLEGIHFRLHHGDEQLSVQVPLLGRHSVHTSLRATAVGLVEGMAWGEIVSGLHGMSGQLRLVAVPGPNDSIILDDTYNSSPESAVAALNLLEDLEGRRIAVLGDMLELGPVEETAHRLVGRRVKEVADILVTVGSRGQLIGEEAVAVGMPAGNVHIVADADEAVLALNSIVQPADVILIKGSHGARLDRIVAALGQD
jgi:UDP-N-acetylmuramoyl-tripeptide--D-alanyl-D-alanine ligase